MAEGVVYNNKIHVGFSIVKWKTLRFTTIRRKPCTQPCSAQLAELKALTTACKIAEGKDVTIHTDSAYARNEQKDFREVR